MKPFPTLKGKKNMYNSVKTSIDGIEFDSKAEMNRYVFLTSMEDVKNLQRQVRFVLKVNGIVICKYRADFVYDCLGERIVEDVKNSFLAKGRDFIKIKKLMKAIHGIDILIVPPDWVHLSPQDLRGAKWL